MPASGQVTDFPEVLECGGERAASWQWNFGPSQFSTWVEFLPGYDGCRSEAVSCWYRLADSDAHGEMLSVGVTPCARTNGSNRLVGGHQVTITVHVGATDTP